MDDPLDTNVALASVLSSPPATIEVPDAWSVRLASVTFSDAVGPLLTDPSDDKAKFASVFVNVPFASVDTALDRVKFVNVLSNPPAMIEVPAADSVNDCNVATKEAVGPLDILPLDVRLKLANVLSSEALQGIDPALTTVKLDNVLSRLPAIMDVPAADNVNGCNVAINEAVGPLVTEPSAAIVKLASVLVSVPLHSTEPELVTVKLAKVLSSVPFASVLTALESVKASSVLDNMP
jgi:hypothetical protein